MADSLFRFMALCRESLDSESGSVTLVDVIDELVIKPTQFPFQVIPVVAVGFVLGKNGQAKRLGIQADHVSGTGAPKSIRGFLPSVIRLPNVIGPLVCSSSLPIPIPCEGLFAVSLLDLDGAFGAMNGLLATYVFGVRADPALAFEDN